MEASASGESMGQTLYSIPPPESHVNDIFYLPRKTIFFWYLYWATSFSLLQVSGVSITLRERLETYLSEMILNASSDPVSHISEYLFFSLSFYASWNIFFLYWWSLSLSFSLCPRAISLSSGLSLSFSLSTKTWSPTSANSRQDQITYITSVNVPLVKHKL